MDFEVIPTKAVTSIFGPHVKIHGCFYRLTQSSCRTVQSPGLVIRYREEEDVKAGVACLMVWSLYHLVMS